MRKAKIVVIICDLLAAACAKPRPLVIANDLVAFLEPSDGPLEAILEPSWGTVGAYQFDMLKKQESSTTAEKGGPAVGRVTRGETLSKQVYLGRVKKSGSFQRPSRFATAMP